MEVATAFVFFVFFRKYGLYTEFFVKSLFVVLLILISFIDLKHRMVPDILGLGGACLGFVLAFFRKPYFFYQDALYAIILCGGISFAIVFCCKKFLGKEIMGYGDIQLLCIIGAFCGLKGAVFSLLAGSVFGTVIGTAVMLAKDKGVKYAIPFGPFLSLGALFFMSYGGRFVYGFLRFISGG